MAAWSVASNDSVVTHLPSFICNTFKVWQYILYLSDSQQTPICAEAEVIRTYSTTIPSPS